MHQTPFHSFHQDHGAHFVEYAGWEMPIRYGSIIDEHHQVRNVGGLFDVSHMGRVKFTGRHARKLLETLLTRRITDMKEMACRYAMVCNQRGGVLDDVLVYRYPEHWLVVVNAANREKLLQHFEQVRAEHDFAATIDDQTLSTAMLAVQGPRVMEKIGKFSSEVPTLKKFHFCIKNLMILKMTVSRTGYTGEDGVEVILPAKMAGMAIKLLLKDAGGKASEGNTTIKPVGLGARDSLRLEAGLPLYGHELDEHTDPFAAGLGFAVSLDKGEETSGQGPVVPRFIGQDALEQVKAQGPSKKLVGLKLEGRRTPRQGQDVLAGSTKVGAITSGCLSPTRGHPIAMAYVQPDHAEAGQELAVAISPQKTQPAEVTPLPFYKRR